MMIAYVLARRTSMSPPPGPQHYYGPPDLLTPSDIHHVFVSATFSWDKGRAERLAEEWQMAYPFARVELGGPAYGDPGGVFQPGQFLREGIVITTRGCPGCSVSCDVPSREGSLRTLPIVHGWNVQDNNLLAAPRWHIEAVLDMLRAERRAAVFGGGLEAARLLAQPWVIDRLLGMRIKELWTSYDCKANEEPAIEAIRLLRRAGMRQRQVRCYVLVGRNGDTVEAAETRLQAVFAAGAVPFAMLWRSSDVIKRHNPKWSAFVRCWTRPAAMFAKVKDSYA